MLQRVVIAAVACAILLSAGARPALAQDDFARFRVGGLLGRGLGGQEDLNMTIDESGMGGIWRQDESGRNADHIEGMLTRGLSAEYLISDRFGVGAEFVWFSGGGGYDWFISIEDEYGWWWIEADADYAPTATVASLYGIYRLPLGDTGVSLRLVAGVGYLHGTFAHAFYGRDRYVEYDGWEYEVVLDERIETSGSGGAFHCGLGAEWNLTDELLVTACATFRKAQIDRLEVDEFRTTENGVPYEAWGINEGEVLRWARDEWGGYFSTEDGGPVELDFGGMQLTVGIAQVF
ncbi:MAG: outer membrane beta-barrel protein [Candidatus Eisenbacteria bacterium]